MFSITSAMPLMPMPPMPTKCTGPMSRGSFIGAPRLANSGGNVLFCAGPRYLQDQPGEPVGGIETAHGSGRFSHFCQILWRCSERGDFGGEPARGEIVLHKPNGACGFLQHA